MPVEVDTMPYHYAIEHTYGHDTRNDDGTAIGRLGRFRTAKERDAWVKDRSPVASINEPGYRHALDDDDETITRANNIAARSPYAWVSGDDGGPYNVTFTDDAGEFINL